MGGADNPGVLVSSMSEANLQDLLYCIKHFNRIGHTCKHSVVEINKVHALYHQRYMKEAHKAP